jgi:two-component system sensor histidine kinase KdpD
MTSERRQEALSLTSRTVTGALDRVQSDEARAFGLHMLFALGLVAATTLAIMALAGVVDLRHTLAIYFIPVLAATLLWGFLEGIATAFICGLVAAFFFFDPIFSFYVANPVELVGLLIFVAAAIVIGYLATELREARRAPAATSRRRTASARSALRCRDTQVGAIVRRNGAGTRQRLHCAGGFGRLLRRLHPGPARVEVAPTGTTDHRDARGDGFVPA